MAAVVENVSKRGLTIDVPHTSQPNNSKLALYKLLIQISTRRYTSVIKVRLVCVGTIYVSMCLKVEELAWVTDNWPRIIVI